MATSPPPTCWRATIVTLAAFTIESAASTPAASPIVSTRPRAPVSGLTPLPEPMGSRVWVFDAGRSAVRSISSSLPVPGRQAVFGQGRLSEGQVRHADLLGIDGKDAEAGPVEGRDQGLPDRPGQAHPEAALGGGNPREAERRQELRRGPVGVLAGIGTQHPAPDVLVERLAGEEDRRRVAEQRGLETPHVE